ncbi:PTB domain-containing engulfment adapter protein 1-like isoform X2 [Rhopalosiphum maidis]|uniref:PTB domain-containing engulfment adapter protein 1-like isoform X2 n=1 Tax=Rhopalosiphum maidis TaxID=43146 RepID=UPI000F0053F5|nr:PTB domain-containing engulfment adapter protein 1-like isoform X2 [Rhopalosiphum maidis]
MRNTGNLLKWTQNSNNKSAKGGGENRNWIHPPEALQKGHIAYIVKFLGNVDVDQPKGFKVIKESIQKLKFNQQVRKAEGSKVPKVELTISVEGVALQDPKTKVIMHQYPLHRISYCADDKVDKQFFSFIVKDSNESERHTCFVFMSDKLAEEITLSIGQAFDLAYKRFLDMEVQRKVMVLQQRVKELENENSVLRQRLSDALSGKIDVEQYMRQNGISDMMQVNVNNGNSSTLINLTNGNSSPQPSTAPPVPPRSVNNNGDHISSSPNETKPSPSVGTRLEGLLLNEMENNFEPRTNNNSATSPTSPPLLAPPPKPARDTGRRSQNSDDIFGLSPFKATPRPAGQPRTSASDPFGMDDFGQSVQNGIENDIGLLDKRIKEMKDGFSRGLSMSTEDFSLESLDPLKK